jgi:N-acetylglucosamine-6-phosphate deacetylase
MDGDPSALAAVEGLIAKHGVTSYCPTTVTAPVDKTLCSLEKLGRAVKNGHLKGHVGARPLGLHLEGPFISRAKCGVHPLNDIAPVSMELFERFWSASQGTIDLMTIAPELPGATELIREATARGVCVSIGHSDADTRATQSALDAGARHTTHTFNAMRKLDHREPGILGVVLSDDRLSADIIVDGVHVAPELVKILLAAKGNERAVLITDAISATGMPDGKYRLGTFEVEVKGLRCTVDGHLAGSVLTMDSAIRNVMSLAHWSLQRSVRLATLNPARVLRVDDRKGSLAAGKDADIVVLSRSGEVIRTIVGGAGI